MAERSLTDQEMIDILEDIARNANNAAARIAAIKTLREIDDGERTPAEGFDELDQSVVKPFVRTKQAA